MGNIAYIEMETHPEILISFNEIMKSSWVFTPHYFVSKKISKMIPFTENVTVCDADLLYLFLQRDKYDFVIFGTAHRNFSSYLKVSYYYKTALIVHNVNFSKATRLQLLLNVFKKDFRYRLKLLLFEGLLSAPEFYKSVKKQFFLDEALYLNAKVKKSMYLPIFTTYADESEEIHNNETVIVIPGTVSNERRNYHHVFSTLKKAKVNDEYRFVFLGKAPDKIFARLKRLEQKLQSNIKISYFEEKLTSDEFANWMKKADVLWCPIRREINFFSFKEFYGLTKMTGNVGDAIHYGKPAIFPDGFPITYPFLFEEKADVFAQFQELKNYKFDFKERFDREKLGNELENLIIEKF